MLIIILFIDIKENIIASINVANKMPVVLYIKNLFGKLFNILTAYTKKNTIGSMNEYPKIWSKIAEILAPQIPKKLCASRAPVAFNADGSNLSYVMIEIKTKTIMHIMTTAINNLKLFFK